MTRRGALFAVTQNGRTRARPDCQTIVRTPLSQSFTACVTSTTTNVLPAVTGTGLRRRRCLLRECKTNPQQATWYRPEAIPSASAGHDLMHFRVRNANVATLPSINNKIVDGSGTAPIVPPVSDTETASSAQFVEVWSPVDSSTPEKSLKRSVVDVLIAIKSKPVVTQAALLNLMSPVVARHGPPEQPLESADTPETAPSSASATKSSNPEPCCITYWKLTW